MTFAVDKTGDPRPLRRLPCRPPDDADDETNDRICDRGSVIPSERWATNARADHLDPDAAPDVNDLLTDFDIEDYCTTFYKTRHYKQYFRRRHPYVTVEILHCPYGAEMPLTVPYEVAAREEERLFKIIYANDVRARYMKPGQFQAWKEKHLVWHDEDDLKPIRDLITVDPLLDEYEYVPCGPTQYKTGWIFDNHQQAHIPVRVDQTPRKHVRVAPRWFRELCPDLGDEPNKIWQSVED